MKYKYQNKTILNLLTILTTIKISTEHMCLNYIFLNTLKNALVTLIRKHITKIVRLLLIPNSLLNSTKIKNDKFNLIKSSNKII